MKRDLSTPGLYAVFRLFILLRLLFAVFSALTQTFSPFLHQHISPAAAYLTIAETIVLLAYLSWPWLQARLGQSYLPVALITATLGPLAETYLSGVSLGGLLSSSNLIGSGIAGEMSGFLLLGGQFQLFIQLLVPYILFSWQYPFRRFLVYCASVALLDILSIILLPGITGVGFGRMIGLVIFLSLLYLFMGYVVSRLVAEQRQQTALLAQANLQLARHSSTLEQLIVSRERNRLAREFHDTLAHTLSALAVELEAVNTLWDNEPPKAHSMLAESLTMTRDGLRETRRAIQALRATPLEDLGLSMAIETLARSLAERNNWTLNLNLPSEPLELPPDVEHGIYRIAEEALRNIAQHARARQVTLDLERSGWQWSLTIRDDGRGFEFRPEQQEDHYGLKGVQERAESIGAAFALEARPGQGTQIRLAGKAMSA